MSLKSQLGLAAPREAERDRLRALSSILGSEEEKSVHCFAVIRQGCTSQRGGVASSRLEYDDQEPTDTVGKPEKGREGVRELIKDQGKGIYWDICWDASRF